MNAETTSEQCRCPVRPYGSSWASGSAWETNRLHAWDAEHGAHPYAKARDELAKALQIAEGAMHSGPAVLDMVADIYDMSRSVYAPLHGYKALEKKS